MDVTGPEATDPHPPPRAPTRTGVLARLDDAVLVSAARVGVSPRAVLGLAVVVVVVVAVLGVRVLHARSAGAPVPLPQSVSSNLAVSGTASPTSATATTTAPTTAPTTAVGATGTASPAITTTGVELLVHVVGRVAHPGVVRVPAGARVQDAVAAAGGVLRGADVAAINLARPVVDGEQVLVPRPGQVPSAAAAGGAGSSAGPSASPSGGAALVLDLNAATATELEALPGVGPVLAGRIVAWRSEHGRFSTVDELSEVSGIGERVLERLRPQVRV